LAGAKIGIGMPVMAELLAGVEYSESREKNLAIVNRHLRLFRVWPLTAEAARVYAQLFAQLRRAGRTIGAIDLMIAAIARTLADCTVVSADSDFDAVPGLRVEDWET
jgi:tRNA(fMet)-specific endonuclease VapC